MMCECHHPKESHEGSYPHRCMHDPCGCKRFVEYEGSVTEDYFISLSVPTFDTPLSIPDLTPSDPTPDTSIDSDFGGFSGGESGGGGASGDF